MKNRAILTAVGLALIATLVMGIFGCAQPAPATTSTVTATATKTRYSYTLYHNFIFLKVYFN